MTHKQPYENKPSFVKAETIAKIYDVTVRAVFHWKDRGRIPHIKIGKTVRFDPLAVAKAIESEGGER